MVLAFGIFGNYPVFANDTSKNESVNSLNFELDEIPKPELIMYVKVVQIPIDIHFGHMQGEETLINIGCTVETDNEENISELIDMLRQGEIKNALNEEDLKPFEPRIGIYLTLQDGHDIKFL